MESLEITENGSMSDITNATMAAVEWYIARAKSFPLIKSWKRTFRTELRSGTICGRRNEIRVLQGLQSGGSDAF